MTTAVDPAFVLAMMLKAEPTPTPWQDTYLATATAISSSANRIPLFPEEDGPAKSAAIAVGVMWHESRFNPKAEGDRQCLEVEPVTSEQIDESMNGPRGTFMRPKVKCKRRGPPQSFCAFQVGKSNFGFLHTTREEILNDIQVCSDAGFTMMKKSFETCSGSEWSIFDRLNHYVTGGGICVKPKHDEGVHRMRKGLWLFAHTPRVNAI